jgi:hypothetical protein
MKVNASAAPAVPVGTSGLVGISPLELRKRMSDNELNTFYALVLALVHGR